MKNKTWFHYIKDAGRPIIYQADKIVSLEARKRDIQARLMKELSEIDAEIKSVTTELQKEVDALWTKEEQKDAKGLFAYVKTHTK